MSEKSSSLKQFMSQQQRNALGNLPTTHANCIEKCKVARPGKTARDKANGHIPYKTNRRIWDDRAKAWVKA